MTLILRRWRYQILTLFIPLAVVASVSPLSADEWVIVDGWALHGISSGEEIGYSWYETRAEADKKKQEWEQIKDSAGKYYDKVEIRSEKKRVLKSVEGKTISIEQGKELLLRLKAAKKAVERAKEVEKGEKSVFNVAERKLTDTIKEYKDMVAQSYRQAVEAKKTLTTGVQSQSTAKFLEVNLLIDRYNRQVTDFQSVMGKSKEFEYSPLARTQLPDEKSTPTPKPLNDDEELRQKVIGTWLSKESEAGIREEMTFHPDGRMTGRQLKDGSVSSTYNWTWKVEGKKVYQKTYVNGNWSNIESGPESFGYRKVR